MKTDRNFSPRHGWWYAACIILLALSPLTESVLAGEMPVRDPREYFFAQSFGDLPEELQTAGEQGKQGMLLFFEADNCPYCKYMLKHVFNQKQVQDYYQQHFVSIAVDIHGDIEIKDLDGITLPSKVFAEQRGIFITPVISFIDLSGAEIFRQPGMIGTPEEFLVLGEYIVSNKYFDTEFSVYKEQRGLSQSGETRITPAEISGTAFKKH